MSQKQWYYEGGVVSRALRKEVEMRLWGFFQDGTIRWFSVGKC
jgi:hypothetical protein